MNDKKPRLLVSGSRSVCLEIDYYEAIIDRARYHNWHIIVGDCYAGVDLDLAYAATNYKYHNVQPFITLYGIQAAPRHKHFVDGHMRYVNVGDQCKTYTERDTYMLSLADYVYCIWDGKSKGTKHVHDCAIASGKIVWLKIA